MAVKVADASALAALLFGEPEGEVIAVKLGNARLAAPALLGFELAKVCLIKTRRHPDQAQALTAAFKLRHRLEVDEMAIDPTKCLEQYQPVGIAKRIRLMKLLANQA